MVLHSAITRLRNIMSSVMSQLLSLIFSFIMSYVTFIELDGVIVLGNCNRSFRVCWETHPICMPKRVFCDCRSDGIIFSLYFNSPCKGGDDGFVCIKYLICVCLLKCEHFEWLFLFVLLFVCSGPYLYWAMEQLILTQTKQHDRLYRHIINIDSKKICFLYA